MFITGRLGIVIHCYIETLPHRLCKNAFQSVLVPVSIMEWGFTLHVILLDNKTILLVYTEILLVNYFMKGIDLFHNYITKYRRSFEKVQNVSKLAISLPMVTSTTSIWKKMLIYLGYISK